MLPNFAQNLRVCRRKWTLLLSRFPQSSAHRPQSQHQAAHRHADSTQSHSSTSNSIWILLLIPLRDSQRNRRRPLAWPTRFLRRTQASQPFHAWLATYPAYADAAQTGTSGKSGCSALRRSLAGSPSRNGNSASLRARTPDDAADILPARPRRQENRKSTTRAPKLPYAKRPVKHVAIPAPVSCSGPLPAASDESLLATNSRPHKYFRLPATRSGSAAAP